MPSPRPLSEPPAPHDAAAAARERLLSRLRQDPFERPMDPASWDYGAILERSDQIDNLFSADLIALAEAGDLESLRAFKSAPWWDDSTLSRVQSEWPERLFRQARFDLLPALVDEWATPLAFGPGPHPGRPIHSGVWTECAGVALGRARGDPALLEAVWRHMGALIDPSGQEHVSDLINAAAPDISPEDFAQALGRGGALVAARSRVAQAVFASRSGYRLGAHFPNGPHTLAPPPAATPERLALASAYLRWLRETRLDDDSHPACSRLLDVSSRFCAHPELAPDLAALFARHGGLAGLPWDEDHFRVLEALDPERQERPFIRWGEALMSPVDQAIAWLSEEGARALIHAGFRWSPEPFLRRCSESQRHPAPFSPERLSPALAIAERLALEMGPSAQACARPPRL